MKKTILWLGMAAFSAVLLLAGVTATMAAHPDVMTLRADGAAVGPTDAYSPKQTCGGCHFNCSTGSYSTDKSTWCEGTSGKAKKDCTVAGNCPDYASLATSDTSHNQGYAGTDGKIRFQTSTTKSPQHGASAGYHSQQGRNEELTAAQRSIWGAPAFINSPGMFGRYCMPSNRQLAIKNIADDSGSALDVTDPAFTAASRKQIEMSPDNWAKSCGVCHVGGGQMEYDRDMNTYGPSSPTGDRYTYLPPRLDASGNVLNGGIVDVSALSGNARDRQLTGDNKAEVDCLMCHMAEIRPAAAYYKNTLECSTTNMTGPADNPNCGNQKVVFMDMTTGIPMTMPDNRFTFAVSDFYDSFNRNIAVSYGYMSQAASAGLGAGIDLATGALKSSLPASISGSKIAGTPPSGNCAQCHARNEADNIGLPGEAQIFGGMIAGYGNFLRLSRPGEAFDWDKISASGACTGNCSNDKPWMEFGCKTGMGKRSQKTGYGSADRWGNGFCLVCDSQNQWSNPQSFCALPSIQNACISKTGIPTLISDDSTLTLIDVTPNGPMPKLIPGKMPDVDVHDASSRGMTCSSCHYSISGTVPERTINGSGQTYTYPSATLEKMDHNLAKGYSMLEKAGDGFEGTVSCASCHLSGENHHPNAAALNAPLATHAGMPAFHLDKIDCRTCHIPYVYAQPGRLMFRDWTAGAYRQTEGSNGNANHFEFAMNLLEGAMTPIRTTPMWITSPEGTKITPMQTNLLPIWTGAVQRASDNSVMWSPAKTRDVTAAAAVVAKQNPGFGIRINGTNDHPPFQGFQLADPLKIDTKAKIEAMASELGTARTGVAASHAAVKDARINLFPLFYDTSHGVVKKEWALGSPSRGGCVMCHASSAINPMTGQPVNPATYSPYSVGFFDGNKEMLQNGMMQMALYDCDNPYIFNMMTTGDPIAGNTPTCDLVVGPPQASGSCDGTQPGTNPNTGAANGTMGVCKQMIAAGLAQQMGVPPDPMMRMDGVEFMQMMAIREGGSAPHEGSPTGCNPMMQMFGLPTGCVGWEYYSRDEIRLYFAKAMQQSSFAPSVTGQTWTNAVTGASEPVPSTLGRVFGVSAQIKKNPGNPDHQNVFDFGAPCRNPLDGSTFPCSDAMPGMTNLVNTAMSANQVLGYTAGAFSKMTDPATAGVAKPAASFSWNADPAISRKVDFNASATTCASGACTYTWNFGDGAGTASGVTTTYTYAAAGTYTVTLSVTDTVSGLSSMTTQSVVARTINTAPTAAATLSVSGMTVTVVDNSTDAEDAASALKVTVTWGDGTSSTQDAGTTFTKNYIAAGTYTVTHRAADTGGLAASADLSPSDPTTLNAKVTVPLKYSVSGSMTMADGTTPLSGVAVYLKQGTSTKYLGSTNTSGAYTINNVAAGTYDVVPAKAGFTFTPATQTVTVGPDATGINFQSNQ